MSGNCHQRGVVIIKKSKIQKTKKACNITVGVLVSLVVLGSTDWFLGSLIGWFLGGCCWFLGGL